MKCSTRHTGSFSFVVKTPYSTYYVQIPIPGESSLNASGAVSCLKRPTNGTTPMPSFDWKWKISEAVDRLRSRYDLIGRNTGAPFLALIYPPETEKAFEGEW